MFAFFQSVAVESFFFWFRIIFTVWTLFALIVVLHQVFSLLSRYVHITPRNGTRSRGDMFVVRTSKPVENLWKNGLFWSRYSFVTHSIDRKPRDWGLARSAYSIKSFLLLGTSGDVPCASEEMACGYWFLRVDLGQIRSEEIVYSRFIKIPLG